jgi:L-iditol 2-dehydrogenase
MPESQCIKLSDHQSIDDGATSEPMAIGLYAVKQALMTGNESIGILGFGPIGMSVLLMAKAMGFERIFVSEKNEARCELARQNGVTIVKNPLINDISKEVSTFEPLLLDVVFECCGQQEALDTAIEICKPGGKVMVIGIPEFDRWCFSADLTRRKELSIIHIRRQNHCTEEALRMLAEGKVDGSAMITHRFKHNDIANAFEMVANYQDGVMKAMIDF